MHPIVVISFTVLYGVLFVGSWVKLRTEKGLPERRLLLMLCIGALVAFAASLSDAVRAYASIG
jgi:hypothetical protein